MKRTTKINLALIGALVVAVTITAVTLTRPVADPIDPAEVTVVAENSHRLDTAPDGSVVFTEFLDLECEVCAAVYPVVEELRQEHDGEVTFVTRYFPLPGHKNSMNAAIAVEAAAEQGQFEAMYHRLFETQAEWGEQQESKTGVFRSYAEDLGLDMAAYDHAVGDPSTQARVQQDFDAGTALGVEATPTIFLDDEPVELSTPDALRQAVQDAVAQKQ